MVNFSHAWHCWWQPFMLARTLPGMHARAASRRPETCCSRRSGTQPLAIDAQSALFVRSGGRQELHCENLHVQLDWHSFFKRWQRAPLGPVRRLSRARSPEIAPSPMIARHRSGRKCSLQASGAGHATQTPSFLDSFGYLDSAVGIVDLSLAGCASSHRMGGEQ